jgi:hypothetical protein
MRHNLIPPGVLGILAALLVVGLSSAQKRSPSPPEKAPLPEPARTVVEEFEKVCADAEEEYQKQVEPVLKRHNQKRSARVHQAGQTAIQKLQQMARDAKDTGRELDEVVLRQTIENLDQTMGRSEVPVPPWRVSRASFQGHHYLAVLASVEWNEAKAMCEKMGGHLAYLETKRERAFLCRLTGDVAVWVGATDRHKKGDWRWLNGKSVSTALWLPQSPLGRTGWNYAILQDGGLRDLGQRMHDQCLGFICEWDQ